MRRFAELLEGLGRSGRGALQGQGEDIEAADKPDEAQTAGLAVEHQDAGEAGRGDEHKEFENGADREAAEDLEDLVHGSQSLTVSTIAGSCLVGTGFLYPEHIGPVRVFGGIGGWVALAGFSYVLERRGYGKGVALLPPDRFGDTRIGLVFIAVVLCCFGVEGAEEIAGSIVFAALLLGGWSDGAWAALVAERRGLGFFGALRQQCTRSKEAQKWLCRFLFAEGRR